MVLIRNDSYNYMMSVICHHTCNMSSNNPIIIFPTKLNGLELNKISIRPLKKMRNYFPISDWRLFFCGN